MKEMKEKIKKHKKPKEDEPGEMEVPGEENHRDGEANFETPSKAEVEAAAHDLLRSEEHKKNDNLMKAVNEFLGRKKKDIDSIGALKDRKKQLEGEME